MKKREKVVLVVDDNREMRELVCEVLMDEGYAVLGAGEGRQALDMLKTIRADLILSDIDMPVMNGLELARNAIAEDAAQRVLLMTGSGDAEARRIAADLGLGIVNKPFQITDLVARVKQLLH